jgi:hypothetical protein
MTERQWLRAVRAAPLLDALSKGINLRKARLLACALTLPFSRLGAFDIDKFEGVLATAFEGERGRAALRVYLKQTVTRAKARMKKACIPMDDSLYADLLRDVFGNPFRPVAFDPALRTPLVVSLATAAYEERLMPSGELALDRLAVLADALEEVGAAEEVVAHLRSDGPHVRGCWAVDLCLDKA